MFSARPVIRRVPIGDGRHCVVVDNVLADPHDMVRQAVARRGGFVSSPVNCYPGMEQPLPLEFDQRLAEFFAQHLRGAFDARRTVGIATRMSLVTLHPEQLSPQQRICHRDARDCLPGEGACAAVLYLFDDTRLGGTSFYRPLRHPMEIDHLLYQARVMDNAAFDAVLGRPPAYFDGVSPYFEPTCTIPAAWNRAIFYDATVFHSGQIDAPELLDADPARGRLTLNAFIRYRRNTAG
jgi:hypothetical protein